MANDTQGRSVPDSGADSYTYNSDGTVATITRTLGSESWLETFTYSSGVLSSTSGWVKQ